MRYISFVLAVALVVSSPAEARPLTVPAKASWQHADTNVIFGPELAGMGRTEITDSGEAELDIMVQYGSNDDTWLTVYLFRPALSSLAVWFDRSQVKILERPEYRHPAATTEAWTFAPPGATSASGMRRMFVPPSGNIKATGLAIVPVGEWLVAFRISSVKLGAEELDRKLGAAIAQVRWPATIAESPPAAPVQPCAGALTYDKKAKMKKPDMGDTLLASALVGAMSKITEAAKDEKKTEKLPTPVWCRQESRLEYGVYRPSDQTNAYTIALEDAGVIVSVRPALALDARSAGYQLSYSELDRTLVYPSFNKLPFPDKALEATRKASPVSTVEGGNNITISVN